MPGILRFLLFLALIAFLRRDSLALPAFWDEGYFISLAHSFYESGFFGIHYSILEPHHPPALQFAFGALLRFVGWNLSAFRWASFIQGAFFLSAVYSLVRLYASAAISWSSSFVALFMPVFLSESALFNPDFFAAGWALFAIRSLVLGRVRLASVLLAIAALVNAPILVVLPAFWFLLSRDAHEKRPVRKIIAFSAPAIGMALGWVLVFYWILSSQGGWGARSFVIWPDWHTWQENPDRITTLGKRFYQLCVVDGRALLVGLAIAGVFMGFYKRAAGRFPAMAFAAAILVQMIFFSFFGSGCERYLAFGLASLIVCSSVSLGAIPRLSPFVCLAMLGFCAYELYQWYTPGRLGFPYDNRRAYVDHVRLIRSAVREASASGSVVVTHWPISDALTKPYLGYVENPFRGRIARLDDSPSELGGQDLAFGEEPVLLIAEPQLRFRRLRDFERGFRARSDVRCQDRSDGPIRLVFCERISAR